MARYYRKNYYYWRRRRYWRRKKFYKSLNAVQKEYTKVNLKMDFLLTPDGQGVGDDAVYKFSSLLDSQPSGFPKATLTFNDILTNSTAFTLYKNMYTQMKIRGCSVYVNCNLGTNAGAGNHVVRLYVSEMHASNLSSDAVNNSTNAFILPSNSAKSTRRYFKYMDKDWVDTDKTNEFNGRIAVGCTPDIVSANIGNYERYNMSVVLYVTFRNSIFNKK